MVEVKKMGRKCREFLRVGMGKRKRKYSYPDSKSRKEKYTTYDPFANYDEDGRESN